MRDIELYQMLLGLTPPWRVVSVEVCPPVPPSLLGEITVQVEYPSCEPIHCPECEAIVRRTGSQAGPLVEFASAIAERLVHNGLLIRISGRSHRLPDNASPDK